MQLFNKIITLNMHVIYIYISIQQGCIEFIKRVDLGRFVYFCKNMTQNIIRFPYKSWK